MCDRLCSGCPFDFYDEVSEMAQNYGCLPTPHDVMRMRVEQGKTWACHSDQSKPCVGALQHLASLNMPYKVIDPVLVKIDEDWGALLENGT